MNKRKPNMLGDRVDRDFLPFVRKPGRYIGGEVNQVKKDLNASELSVAVCFPDVYEVGSSYLGSSLIYDILNRIEGVAAERVYAPWIDAEEVLRRNTIPLFSLESSASLDSFDVVAFSLTHELCLTNVLNMLDLGGIPVRSCNRDSADPIVIAGGPMAQCCEPASAFIDVFVLGDGEQAIQDLANLIRREKNSGLARRRILENIAGTFSWAYVPALYEFRQGRLIAVVDGIGERFSSAVIEDFEHAPMVTSPLIPFVQAVHERATIEIMRGCPGRCRFCQASFCRRPLRWRSVEAIVQAAKACYRAGGFDTVSLLSLSTAGYPHLEELIGALGDYFHDRHVGISVPSLRVDQQLKLLPRLVSSVRKSGLTIAVEAADENLRRIINKPLGDDDLFAAVSAACKAGWRRIKLYFMVGLPGEDNGHPRRIVELAVRLAEVGRVAGGGPIQVNVAVGWFVPKPHTPFGWLGQKSMEYFHQARRDMIDEKKVLRAKTLHIKFHRVEQSALEAAVARGGRELCDVIETAWRAGARFDAWDECFDFERWNAAFARHGLDLEQAAGKTFSRDEPLPWEHLGGPGREYLLGHLDDAMAAGGK